LSTRRWRSLGSACGWPRSDPHSQRARLRKQEQW
jgi:hypothetical protein